MEFDITVGKSGIYYLGHIEATLRKRITSELRKTLPDYYVSESGNTYFNKAVAGHPVLVVRFARLKFGII